MKIIEQQLEYFILKRRLANILKFLFILHFIIGSLLIITISGLIPGIISIILGVVILKLYKGIPDIEETTFLFFKNLWLLLLIYTISFILIIIFSIFITIGLYMWEAMELF